VRQESSLNFLRDTDNKGSKDLLQDLSYGIWLWRFLVSRKEGRKNHNLKLKKKLVERKTLRNKRMSQKNIVKSKKGQ